MWKECPSTVKCGGMWLRTCICSDFCKIIGAGRNVFAAIIICSLASHERAIIFFTVSRVSELLDFSWGQGAFRAYCLRLQHLQEMDFPAVIFSVTHTHTRLKRSSLTRSVMVPSSEIKWFAEKLRRRHYLGWCDGLRLRKTTMCGSCCGGWIFLLNASFIQLDLSGEVKFMCSVSPASWILHEQVSFVRKHHSSHCGSLTSQPLFSKNHCAALQICTIWNSAWKLSECLRWILAKDPQDPKTELIFSFHYQFIN